MIGRYVTVVCDCDGIGVIEHYRICVSETDALPNATQAREAARTAGWKRRKGKDICPNCLAHFEGSRTDG